MGNDHVQPDFPNKITNVIQTLDIERDFLVNFNFLESHLECFLQHLMLHLQVRSGVKIFSIIIVCSYC